MFRVAKTFRWEAGHQLAQLPKWHKCSAAHGHSYSCEIVMESADLDEYGFISDVANLSPAKAFIEREFDDKLITISTEQMARQLFEVAKKHCPQTVKVRVYEGPNIWAEYEATP